LAVIGAGAMGAGIAASAVRAGIDVTLLDVDEAALAAGRRRVEAVLRRSVERGRLAGADADSAVRRLRTSPDLADAAGCAVAIEAVPERLELKRSVLAELGRVAPAAVLASNTSSISIGALADAAPVPERVLGLHFFNPPEAMRLVELVVTPRTDPAAAQAARGIAEAMGKTVVQVADGPGFLVNRCARPYYLEALRIVEDGIATPAQVDRICRLGGGFPMGPFELMDLIGIDVSLAVTRSMWEQSFGEPRWRPSPLQAHMVAAGRLGRKTGAGFRAGPNGADDAADPEPQPGAPAGPVVIAGDDVLARELRALARARGVTLAERAVTADALTIATTPEAVSHAPRGTIALACDVGGPEIRRGLRACGFGLVPPLAGVRIVELAQEAWTDPRGAHAAAALFGALGLAVEPVRDAPGLVLARIVAQLVNEAAFAGDAAVAAPELVDVAMTAALGYPRGPVAWGRLLGPERVVGVLDALWEHDRDPRYRVAPSLRRGSLDWPPPAADG
jgi:3-hydroxybutyryl-CoA dehydrogenase